MTNMAQAWSSEHGGVWGKTNITASTMYWCVWLVVIIMHQTPSGSCQLSLNAIKGNKIKW